MVESGCKECLALKESVRVLTYRIELARYCMTGEELDKWLKMCEQVRVVEDPDTVDVRQLDIFGRPRPVS